MFERIMVPLDGSERAEVVLPQILRLARREDVELLLVRAISADLPPAGLGAVDLVRLLEDGRQEAQRYLHAQVQRLRSAGVGKVHARVVEGPTAQTLLETAEAEDIRLIALATHGRTGAARWLMGSVAEQVARKSAVPVLVVRSFRRNRAVNEWDPAPRVEQPVRRILVPTDGSEAARAVADPARKLAQLYGAEIVLLHVAPIPYPAPGPALPGMMPAAILPMPEPPKSEDDPATQLLAERFAHAGLQVTRMTVLGDPATEIVDHPFVTGIDLIAMASHGRSGLDRLLLGSVAERVLRHAGVPVLIVRSQDPAAAAAVDTAAAAGRED